MKLIVTAIVAAIVLVLVIPSYIGAYNKGNRLEKGIIATYENNRNILSQYSTKLAEAAQIPAMQRDDLTKVVEAALTARYGENGSEAVIQFIQEQNPQIDSTVYVQLQRIIEAGRTDFERAQTKLIDQIRVYDTALDSFWTGLWLGIAGYPSINLDDYKVVLSARAVEVFEKGIEEPIQLRP